MKRFTGRRGNGTEAYSFPRGEFVEWHEVKGLFLHLSTLSDKDAIIEALVEVVKDTQYKNRYVGEIS